MLQQLMSSSGACCASQFPYYTFVDRGRMYTIGSLFYAIYFFVSFPMFFMMDEDASRRKWTLGQATVDSLAASMLVTMVLDLWRLGIGSIVDDGGGKTGGRSSGLPWL